MSRITQFYRQLKRRRVIRTAVVYVALVWGALQVADLLAEAEFITEQLVRWLIFAALVGFPLTLVLSWFFETPWRERKSLSVLGDIAIILAIAVGAGLLAWQQYFTSFSRPTLAILTIEATDTRPDTPAFGAVLSAALRTALSTRNEIRVIELESSQHAALQDRPIHQRAEVLRADYLLAGTLNQGDDTIRINLQLFDSEGKLTWSERYEDALVDLTPALARIFNDLWDQLPLPPEALEVAREVLSGCPYPRETEAVRALVESARAEHPPEQIINELSKAIERLSGNGMLHLARAHAYLRQLSAAPLHRHPILNRLAMQDFQRMEELCPAHPAPGLARLHTTRALEASPDELESTLADYPNDARIRIQAARIYVQQDQPEAALAMSAAALKLDPLSTTAVCAHAELREAEGLERAAEGVRYANPLVGTAVLDCGQGPVMQ
ncbi:MAG: hypothetical protein R3348_04015 [Xanthomonadales bacterium]|nr:hypothetical protein [Xanthomonadales bacterium]